MAARPQWNFWSIGVTNNVQPYWRLAIITMQPMPRASWTYRPAGIARAGGATDAVLMAIVAISRELPVDLVFLPPIGPLRFYAAAIRLFTLISCN
jgi:hypothetical protein